jgi:hypothetical protein
VLHQLVAQAEQARQQHLVSNRRVVVEAASRWERTFLLPALAASAPPVWARYPPRQPLVVQQSFPLCLLVALTEERLSVLLVADSGCAVQEDQWAWRVRKDQEAD